MFDPRPVLFLIGLLLCPLACAMLPSALLDLWVHDGDWMVFAASAGTTLLVGLGLVLGMRAPRAKVLSVRQICLGVVLGWTVAVLFASLPFALGRDALDWTDAIFEAAAGLTATASTLLPPPERLGAGVLLWRSVLQWMGGLGALAMAVAVLPVLRVGGMEIFRVEGGVGDAVRFGLSRTGVKVFGLYTALTLAALAALIACGLPPFEAGLRAMAVLSAGGYPLGAPMAGGWAGLVLLAGMIAAGLPFPVLVRALEGDWSAVRNSRQLRWYAGVLTVASAALIAWGMLVRGAGWGEALTLGPAAAAGALTGTSPGMVSGGFPATLLLFLGLLGGCAGSVTGGIKIFRLRLLVAGAWSQMRLLLHPHAVLSARDEAQTVTTDIRESVMGFLLIYALTFAALALSLALFGLDFESAVVQAARAIADFGGGTGPGPGFAAQPDGVKATLTIGMILGRVEIYPVLVLFAPTFWES